MWTKYEIVGSQGPEELHRCPFCAWQFIATVPGKKQIIEEYSFNY